MDEKMELILNILKILTMNDNEKMKIVIKVQKVLEWTKMELCS
jgi:hypothetical protein